MKGTAVSALYAEILPLGTLSYHGKILITLGKPRHMDRPQEGAWSKGLADVPTNSQP